MCATTDPPIAAPSASASAAVSPGNHINQTMIQHATNNDIIPNVVTPTTSQSTQSTYCLTPTSIRRRMVDPASTPIATTTPSSEKDHRMHSPPSRFYPWHRRPSVVSSDFGDYEDHSTTNHSNSKNSTNNHTSSTSNNTNSTINHNDDDEEDEENDPLLLVDDDDNHNNNFCAQMIMFRTGVCQGDQLDIFMACRHPLDLLGMHPLSSSPQDISSSSYSYHAYNNNNEDENAHEQRCRVSGYHAIPTNCEYCGSPDLDSCPEDCQRPKTFFPKLRPPFCSKNSSSTSQWDVQDFAIVPEEKKNKHKIHHKGDDFHYRRIDKPNHYYD